ncbi:hypothetical protein [Actinoplanes siamensis]|uniref:hypothetical protein n=1 Tax=Actinoplanes siamensis TaxID=1223317 RepID=UPI001942DD73|nr:hypothetical protein [Actinoplanes siamensis]
MSQMPSLSPSGRPIKNKLKAIILILASLAWMGILVVIVFLADADDDLFPAILAAPAGYIIFVQLHKIRKGSTTKH